MPPQSKARFRQRIWIAYWLLIFTATHVPAGDLPHVGRRHVDKVVHFGLYMGLAVLAGRYLGVTKTVRFRHRALLWAGVFVAYGAFDEWLQQYTHRSMDFWDWVADVCGIVSGSALVALWPRPPSRA